MKRWPLIFLLLSSPSWAFDIPGELAQYAYATKINHDGAFLWLKYPISGTWGCMRINPHAPALKTTGWELLGDYLMRSYGSAAILDDVSLAKCMGEQPMGDMWVVKNLGQSVTGAYASISTSNYAFALFYIGIAVPGVKCDSKEVHRLNGDSYHYAPARNTQGQAITALVPCVLK